MKIEFDSLTLEDLLTREETIELMRNKPGIEDFADSEFEGDSDLAVIEFYDCDADRFVDGHWLVSWEYLQETQYL